MSNSLIGRFSAAAKAFANSSRVGIPRAMTSGEIRTSSLSNGVRVVTRYIITHSKDTDISIAVGAGSWDEINSPYPRGTAHFFEHMPPRSSYKCNGNGEKYADWEIYSTIRAAGGTFNAKTGADITEYKAIVPNHMVAQAVSMLSSMVCNPVLTESNVHAEREPILVEWGDRYTEAMFSPYMNAESAAYGGHPMLDPVLGKRALIESIQAKDLVSFHKEKYLNSNTVIAVEGAVDHHFLCSQLEREFHLSSGDKYKHVLPAYVGGASICKSDRVNALSMLAFNGPEQTDIKKQLVFDVLVHSLVCGKDPLLFRKLRLENSLVYNVAMVNNPDTENIGIIFSSSSANVKKSIQIISEILSDVRQGVYADRLEGAKCLLAFQRYPVSAGYKEDASRLARSLLKTGRVLSNRQVNELCRAITQQDIAKAVDEMLSRRPTLAVTGDVSHVPGYKEVCDIFHVPTSARPSKPAAKANAGGRFCDYF